MLRGNTVGNEKESPGQTFEEIEKERETHGEGGREREKERGKRSRTCRVTGVKGGD